ncbi:protein takeout-like [Atheta coriaria]|uniref:protein takeout-like n=1 Tax=Dalotia coriaria TaxID=877792 RepID=UPI0031F477A6
MAKLLILLFICVVACWGKKLPSYITKCKFHDPSMTKCMKDNIPNIKPHLKEGIKELSVPPLVPFHLAELVIEATKDLVIKLSDLDVFDLDSFDVREMISVPEEFLGKLDLYFEKIQIIGTYDIDGKILILPIKGHGPANITLYQFLVHYEYIYRPVEINGKPHLQLTNGDFQFRAGKISLQLDNLFNGDKALGEQVNAFLNENWKEIEDILRPSITETVKSIIDVIFNSITNNVALEDLFAL